MVFNRLRSYSNLKIFQKHFTQLPTDPLIVDFLAKVHGKFYPEGGFTNPLDFYKTIISSYTKEEMVRFIEDEEAREIYLTFAPMLMLMPSDPENRANSDDDYYLRIQEIYDVARLY
jgi:hypothetical protein